MLRSEALRVVLGRKDKYPLNGSAARREGV